MTKIYEVNNIILINTGYGDPLEHTHNAAHVIISLNGDMKITSNGKDYFCRGAMIPSGVSHKIDTNNNSVIVFLYDSTTNVAMQMKEIQSIKSEKCDNIISLFNSFEIECSLDSFNVLEKFVLEQFKIEKSLFSVTDERMINALKYIRDNITEKLTCQDVADAVFLSQGRFSHLFKGQVGMTFAAYLVYQKIMKVYFEVINGKSITEASIMAGFSSSSHFADVNRRVFGISASNLLQDLEFIKVK